MPPINPTGPGLSDFSSSKFFQDERVAVVLTGQAGFTPDEDDGWWASIEQLGARVAIVTALVATSLSTAVAAQQFQQDDLPVQKVVDESDWTAPRPIPPTSRLWVLQGTGGTSNATYQLEEENYYPPVIVPHVIQSPPQWQYETSDIVVQFHPEEEYYLSTPYIQPIFQFPKQFDSGEFVPTAAFVPNEEYGWPPSPFPPQPGRLFIWQGTGGVNPATYQIEEEPWKPPVIVPHLITITPPYGYDEPQVFAPTSIFFDETGLIVPVPPEPVTTVLLFLDDGENVFSSVDEDYWQKPLPMASPMYPLATPWSFDDAAIGTQKATHEDYWINHYPLIPLVINMAPPYSYDPMDIVPQPAQHQNYIDPGVHNYVSQEIGTGVKF